MSRKVNISAKVSEDVNERLDALAERIGWTKSELIAHSLEYGLREGEKCADRISGPILGTIIRMLFSIDTSDPEAMKAIDHIQRHAREQNKLNKKLGNQGT